MVKCISVCCIRIMLAVYDIRHTYETYMAIEPKKMRKLAGMSNQEMSLSYLVRSCSLRGAPGMRES
jgi:hypothetical protein